MVGFDEDASDEDITEEQIRAAKNLLNVTFKKYEKKYGKPYGKASNNVLEEILNGPADEKSDDGFKSYLLSLGKYEGSKDVIGMLRVSPNKNKITIFAYLEQQKANNIYFVQGDIVDNALIVKYFVKTDREFNEEAKYAWKKENIIDAAGLAAYLEETLRDLGINSINLSYMEETKDKQIREILRKILKVLGEDYNIKII